MLANAQNVSIRGTAIHNAGRDMIIVNHIYVEPETVRARSPDVTYLDDLWWNIVVSFKHIPESIFGDHYVILHSFGTDIFAFSRKRTRKYIVHAQGITGWKRLPKATSNVLL